MLLIINCQKSVIIRTLFVPLAAFPPTACRCPTSRQIHFLPHYVAHMKLHDEPLRCFCYHAGCSQRFATLQALREHLTVHEPLQARCHFAACDLLFPSLTHAYDHEWRHYIPTPQRHQLNRLGPDRQKTASAEAPWKQRVKVEEAWLPSRKPVAVAAAAREQPESIGCGAEPEDSKSDQQGSASVVVNGCEGADSATSPPSPPALAPPPPPPPAPKKRLRVDAIDVHDHRDEMSTMAEGVQKTLGEPHIAEHKSFKPEDPAHAPLYKAPFVRPPPSTYLNESVLSMRRERCETQPEQKTRSRCDKCLSSFSSGRELEQHRALNTCSALFGFDSDDDS